MRAAGRWDWSRDALIIALRILLCGYVAVTVVSSLAAKVEEFDDAIPLVHGMLVQQGRIPNLDFPSFYPPLGLYVNAAAFSLLGRTVLAPRAVAALLYILALFLTGRYFRSRFPYSRSLVPLAVLLVAASIGSALTLPVWPGFAISLAALLTYLCFHSDVRNRRSIIGISGILTGLALLYRVNFGAYVAFVVVGDLLLQWYLGGKERWGRVHLRNSLLTLLAYACPLIVCSVGLCFWLYGRNIAVALYQFTVNTQKTMLQRGFINLEYTADLSFALILPLGWFSFRILKGKEELSAKALVPAVFAIALVGVTLAGRTHPSIALIAVSLQLASVVFLHFRVHRLERSELCLVLFFCCLLHYYLSRADWFHWRILPVVEAMLLVFLVFSRFDKNEDGTSSSVSKGTALAVLASAVCVLLAAADFRPEAAHLRNGAKLIASFAIRPHLSDTDRLLGPNPPEAMWTSVYPDTDELQTLRYLRTITGSTDSIFVGVQDHSRVFWNNLRIYWLAGRPIGARVFQLEPRVASEESVQREIISDLERNGVKCVIIDRHSYLGDATFLMSGYVGSKLLDKYISSHFREKALFGRFAILTKVKTALSRGIAPDCSEDRGP
jgi:4-amino-4-deoxy-L-arabinose transferase-like glycosyltransferase